MGEEGRDLWGGQDPPGLPLRLRGRAGQGPGPGLLLALPFKIRPSVEETLGIQQACSEGVARGAFFGAAAPHTPSPQGRGSQDQSLCVLSQLPPPQTMALTPSPWGEGAGAWGGWCQDWVEHGQGHRGGKEGMGGGCASPKEPRPAWHQCQGDPAYLHVAPRTLARGRLISARAH